MRGLARRTLLALIVASVFVLAGATAVAPPRVEHPHEPPQLADLRSRLVSFQTAVVETTWRKCVGSCTGSGVLRVERKSGRLTIDSGWRVLWDGTQLWIGRERDLPPRPLSRLASSIMADLMDEVLAGLPNATFVPEGAEDWGPGNVRVDLPFAWDNAYAILVQTDGTGDPSRFSVVRRDTREPLVLQGIALRDVEVAFDWDVRLYPDLSDARNISARRQRVANEDGRARSVDTPFRPPWHDVTTHNQLSFDPHRSEGWTNPDGSAPREEPRTQLADVECTSTGQVVSKPIAFRYDVDDTHESFPFLTVALAEGCPVRVKMGESWTHRPAPGARTHIQATVRLLDTSVEPPLVLDYDFVDEVKHGRADTSRPSHVTDEFDLVPRGGVIPRVASRLELRIDGFVRVECFAPGQGKSDVDFAVGRGAYAPILSWPDCYPELGIVPGFATCES